MTLSFDEAIRDAPRVITVARVISQGVIIEDLLRIAGGQVHIDETAAFRRSLQNLEIDDPTGELIPALGSDILAPFGNEIQIYNGVFGQPVYPVGVFRISQDDVVHLGGGATIAISGYDRSRQISRNVWDTPYVIAAAVNVIDAAVAIAIDRMPGVQIDVQTVTTVTTPPLQYREGDDPWNAMVQILAPAGIEVLFNATGQLVIRDVPTVTVGSQPVAGYVHGEGSTITQLQSTLNDDPGVNQVVGIAQSSSLAAPLTAVHVDDIVGSPTNIAGKYGVVTSVLNSSTATTLADLQRQVDDEFNRLVGGTEQLRISALNDARRAAGDIIAVDVDRVQGLYIASSVTLDLGLGDMSITTRRQRV